MARAAAGAGTDGGGVGDLELAAAAATGERAAFEELYRRNVPVAWRVAHAVAGNPDDASDAVADAFERVFRAVTTGKLSDNDAFRPYLLTATRRAAIDISRRARRAAPVEGIDRVEVEAPAAGPDDRVVAELESRVLIRAFKGLDQRWRSVLWLTEVEELSCQEVGAVLGLTPGNVAQLAFRARIGLRKRYLEALLSEHARPECQPVLQRFASYAEGGLRRRQAAGVDQHLSGCEACRRRLDELKDLGVTLRRSALPVPVVLGSVVAGVWTRVGGVADVPAKIGASLPTWAPRVVSMPNWVPDVVPQAAAATPVMERVATWATAGLLVLGLSAGVASTEIGTPADPSPGSAVEHVSSPAPEDRQGLVGGDAGPVSAAPGVAGSTPADPAVVAGPGSGGAALPAEPSPPGTQPGVAADPAVVAPVSPIGGTLGSALGPDGAVGSLVPAAAAVTSQVGLPTVDAPLTSSPAGVAILPSPADLTTPIKNTLDAAPALDAVTSPPMASTADDGAGDPQPAGP